MATAALEFTLLMDAGNISRSMEQARRSVAEGVRGMARVARDEGRRIQSALSDITRFRELKQGVAEARGEWAKAQGEVARLAAALSAVAAPTRAMQREFEQAKRASTAAKAAFEAKRDALQKLRGDLRATGVDTANLTEGQRRLREELARNAARFRQQQRLNIARDVIGLGPSPNTAREITRVQSAYERLRASGTLTASELARAHLAMTTRITALRNGTEGWAARLSLVREQLASLAVAGAGMGLAAREAIRFESAMANIRKVVNFPTPQAFADMSAEIKAMSREIPVSLEGLARIAEAGGQMGIAAKEIRGFTEVVAKMSTAFKISPEEAGIAVGRLMNVFSLTVPQTRLLADAINHLGNNTNAVERDIVEVMNRTGGMARVFGLANTETAALAATFLSMGLGPERSATAINALTRELMNAPQQTDKFKAALQRIGLSAEEMAAAIHRGPQQAILHLLQLLSGLDKQTRMETLVGLFGDLYSDEIVQVVNNLDKYRQILGLVGKESNFADSMQKEFGERVKTTEAQLQLAKNAVSEAAVNLGTAFLPAIVAVARALAALMQGLAGLIQRFPVLSASAVTALTALAGFGALRLVWSAVRAGVISLIQPLLTLVTTSGSVTAALGALAVAARGVMFTPLGLAMTAAGVAAYAFSRSLGDTVQPLRDTAAALGKSRQETAEKIRSLEELQKTLATTKPGTREHVEAEEKLARILPEANLSLDEQGRVLARVGAAASDNAGKLKAFIDLLKKEERQTLALQLDTQARAFGEAKKEMTAYAEGLRDWYGIGTEEAQSASQKFWLWLNKLTGTYDDNIGKGAELRRTLGETGDGLKSLLEEARKSGLSLEELGRAMEAIHADPDTKAQVLDLYRSMAVEAENAARTVASLDARLKQFSIAMTGPAAAARKSIVEAIGTADQQISRFDQRLGQHRQSLKQAVDDETRSWQAMGEAAASSSRTTTERIEQEAQRRRNRLELLAGADLVSERRKVQGITALAIQETGARLVEARRYQGEALSLVRREYHARMEHAQRLGQVTTRVNEEMLQAKKRILEQTESAYRGSIDKLIAEERRHLEAARQLDEQRMSFRLSAEERMARLSERGMSPEQVYHARQRRILQEQERAEEAMRSGNYEAARRHAERMMELAEQSAEGVKSGNRIIVSEQEAVARAQEQVRQAALLADQTYQQQGDTHRQAAASLRDEYEGLSSHLERVRDEIDALGSQLAREHRLILSADTAKVEESARQIDDLLEKKERVVKIRAELQDEARFLEGIADKVSKGMMEPVSRGLNQLSERFATFKADFAGWDPEIKAKFDATAATGAIDGLVARFRQLQETFGKSTTVQVEARAGQAIEAMDQVTSKANALDGRVVTYTVRQITQEAHALGGPVGLARGGRLPGYGGGDRIQALLEAGEFVIRKEAVRRYGLGLLESINRMRLSLPELPRFASGGLVQNLFIPPVPAFASGGQVAAVGAGQSVNINLSFGGGESFPLQTGRDIADRLVRHLQELQRGR